jgi:hypothetical protein
MIPAEVMLIRQNGEANFEITTKGVVEENSEGDRIIEIDKPDAPDWFNPGNEVAAFHDGKVVAAGKAGKIEIDGWRYRITVECANP